MIGSDPWLPESQRRRWQLFLAVMPLLERARLRELGVTDLAEACSLRPASLYHYFPSKLALALFPISTDNGSCEAWRRRARSLPPDPAVRLPAFIDHLVGLARPLRVALAISREAASDPTYASEVSALARGARRDFREMCSLLSPAVDVSRVDELFDAFAAILVGTVPGVELDSERLRRQMTDVARGWLARAGLDADVLAGSDGNERTLMRRSA